MYTFPYFGIVKSVEEIHSAAQILEHLGMDRPKNSRVIVLKQSEIKKGPPKLADLSDAFQEIS